MRYFNKQLVLVMIFTVVSLKTNASELALLVEMLHENGTVSDAQYRRLKQELKSNQQKKIVEEESKQPDYQVKLDKGIKITSKDKQFEMKIGGRIQADGAWYGEDETAFGNGTEIRRARMYLQGTVYYDWKYKLQYDFANSGIAGIRDAYLAYTGFDAIELKVGHFKVPFSVDNQNSSKHILFTERSLANALAPPRRIGLSVASMHKDWTATAGLFGVNAAVKGGSDDESWGIGSRVTYAPFAEQGKFWMLGVSGDFRELGGSQRLRFLSQPETHIAGVRLIDTGTMTDVENYWVVGAESSAVYGPFSTQAEYIHTTVNRKNHGTPNFDGWYVQAGYFLTGESRTYKNGKLTNITPNANFGADGWGAWEIGLRFSSLDLNSRGIEGGHEQNFTAGLNWFVNPVVRLSANYVKVLSVKGGEHDGDTPDLVQGRVQVAF